MECATGCNAGGALQVDAVIVGTAWRRPAHLRPTKQAGLSACTSTGAWVA